MASSVKLNQINLNQLHLLSMPVKLIITVILGLLVVVLAYFALFSGQLDELKAAKEQENKLKTDFESKAIQAANLPVLKKELEEIRTAFAVLLKQLPTEAEVPNLIQELHQAGAANGMRMNSVQPMPTVADGPIQVLPYSISVSGKYDQLSKFARDVGQLSRIITLDDLNINTDGKSGNLVMNATANTYKAVEEQKIAAAPAKPAQPAAGPAASEPQ